MNVFWLLIYVMLCCDIIKYYIKAIEGINELPPERSGRKVKILHYFH